VVQLTEPDDEVVFCHPYLVWLFRLKLDMAGESHVRVVANQWLPPEIQGVRFNLTRMRAFVPGHPIRFAGE
jgi:hypothetical protein